MNDKKYRKWHRIIAPIVFLPLFLTVITGIGYRLGKSWFGLSSEQAEIFMVIHQGTYLGDDLKPFYVLLNGIGLIFMMVTGITMSGVFRKKRLTD
ncbi:MULTISPECIES: hypothetical protein [Okeania]|uniref:PepSY domain-containing protein n=1 Tax=Okeania hirsuta TaxID=1458930 RepID=A0A3N6NZI0_9CYAN|nr:MULTISPECIES: hypothetical protein [Okeania]NET11939.1 hypothetical protein [Okeania sp. SIO1H6]NES76208.1 hypothetical protein [Okeania sp. SIO1H4]NET19650.1 hypothetical protein [Okeania sp. SIO1H5]NET74672.1 hypothetical protein [Okeania sp. SIO1F9]NET93575.1 hypothetical protein [Okeania sp. SIO1H2]